MHLFLSWFSLFEVDVFVNERVSHLLLLVHVCKHIAHHLCTTLWIFSNRSVKHSLVSSLVAIYSEDDLFKTTITFEFLTPSQMCRKIRQRRLSVSFIVDFLSRCSNLIWVMLLSDVSLRNLTVQFLDRDLYAIIRGLVWGFFDLIIRKVFGCVFEFVFAVSVIHKMLLVL